MCWRLLNYEDTNNRRNDLTKTKAMVDLEEVAIEEEKDNLLIKSSSSVSIFITSSISSMNALIERRRPIMLRLMMKEILLMWHKEQSVHEGERWYFDSGCSNHMIGNKAWFTLGRRMFQESKPWKWYRLMNYKL